MKWYIGQKVVYVGKENPEFHNKIWEVRQIRKGCCYIQLDIGLPSRWIGSQCAYCGRIEDTNIVWKNENVIRPLEDNFAEEVLEKALKEGIKLADELPRKV